MSGMVFATSLLKFVPTIAKVNNKVTPRPRDIIVIGVMLFVWVIFLTETFNEILDLFFKLLRKKTTILDNRKNTIKHIKKALKYIKL